MEKVYMSNNIKPIEEYKNQSFKKTTITAKLEERLSLLNTIDNDIFQKSLNTTYKLVSTLNTNEPLECIENLIDDIISNIDKGSIKILKTSIGLLNSELENLIKPKNDIVIKPTNNNKKLDLVRLKSTLFKNRFLKGNQFFIIFYALSLLTYTKDKNVIFRVNNLSDIGLVDFVKKNYKFFSFSKLTLDTLYSYGGGKKKFYDTLHNHIKKSGDKTKFKKFIDLFFGGGGSFYDCWNVIKENNMSCVLNDLNPSILNLNKHIQSKRHHKQIMKNISYIIQQMFIKTAMFEPSHSEYQKLHQRLLKVLNWREKREGKDTTVMTSSILLFLLNNNFGGNYTTTKNGSYCSIPTDMEKVDRFFNFVGKIEFYHYLYTSVKVKFENKDYEEVLKKHCRKNDTYTTIDPPYLNPLNIPIYEYKKQMEELNELIKKSTTKKDKKKYSTQMNKLLKGSPYNYGFYGDNFKHEQLLENMKMIKGEISYFNYTHPILGEYSYKNGLNIELLGRKSNNGQNEKGKEIKEKFETFMTGTIKSMKGGK